MVTQYGRPYAEGRFEPTDNYKGCYGAFGGRGELKFNGGARGYIRKVPTSEGSQSARNFGGIRTYLSLGCSTNTLRSHSLDSHAERSVRIIIYKYIIECSFERSERSKRKRKIKKK